MPTLAEGVINTVNQSADEAGKTVGNAIQAYQVAGQLEQNKQKLKMDQDNNKIAMAKSMMSSLDGLARYSPEMQKQMLPSLNNQYRQMFGGEINEDTLTMLAKDKKFQSNMFQLATGGLQAMSEGHQLSSQGADAFTSVFKGEPQDAIPAAEKMIEARSHYLGQVNGAQMIKAQTAMGNQSSMAIDKVLKDEPLNNYQARIAGAQRILSQLDDARSGKMVDTEQFLGELGLEYNNMVTGANNPALGKTEMTAYSSGATKMAGIIQKIKNKPTSINAPEFLDQMETAISGLENNYRGFVDKRADALKRHFPFNPDAEQQMNSAVHTIKSDWGVAGYSARGGQKAGNSKTAANAPQPSGATHASGAVHNTDGTWTMNGKTYAVTPDGSWVAQPSTVATGP
jgi:hypothetical protein